MSSTPPPLVSLSHLRELNRHAAAVLRSFDAARLVASPPVATDELERDLLAAARALDAQHDSEAAHTAGADRSSNGTVTPGCSTAASGASSNSDADGADGSPPEAPAKRRARKLREQHVSVLNNLGTLYHRTGRYMLALASLGQALGVAQGPDAAAADSVEGAATLLNLSALHNATGESHLATTCALRVVSLFTKIPRSLRAIALHNLAMCDYDASDAYIQRRVVVLLQRALAEAEMSFGAAHPTTDAIRRRLAEFESQHATLHQNATTPRDVTTPDRAGRQAEPHYFTTARTAPGVATPSGGGLTYHYRRRESTPQTAAVLDATASSAVDVERISAELLRARRERARAVPPAPSTPRPVSSGVVRGGAAANSTLHQPLRPVRPSSQARTGGSDLPRFGATAPAATPRPRPVSSAGREAMPPTLTGAALTARNSVAPSAAAARHSYHGRSTAAATSPGQSPRAGPRDAAFNISKTATVLAGLRDVPKVPIAPPPRVTPQPQRPSHGARVAGPSAVGAARGATSRGGSIQTPRAPALSASSNPTSSRRHTSPLATDNSVGSSNILNRSGHGMASRTSAAQVRAQTVYARSIAERTERQAYAMRTETNVRAKAAAAAAHRTVADAAAIKIQRAFWAWRGRQARRRARVARRDGHPEFQPICSCCVPHAGSGEGAALGEHDAGCLREQRRQLEDHARHTRVQQQRRLNNMLTLRRRPSVLVEADLAAATIQRAWRCAVARAELRRRQWMRGTELEMRLSQRRWAAAMRVQTCFRRWACERVFREVIAARRARQAVERAQTERLAALLAEAEATERSLVRRQERAAVKIQAMWRGFAGRVTAAIRRMRLRDRRREAMELVARVVGAYQLRRTVAAAWRDAGRQLALTGAKITAAGLSVVPDIAAAADRREGPLLKLMQEVTGAATSNQRADVAAEFVRRARTPTRDEVAAAEAFRERTRQEYLESDLARYKEETLRTRFFVGAKVQSDLDRAWASERLLRERDFVTLRRVNAARRVQRWYRFYRWPWVEEEREVFRRMCHAARVRKTGEATAKQRAVDRVPVELQAARRAREAAAAEEEAAVVESAAAGGVGPEYFATQAECRRNRDRATAAEGLATTRIAVRDWRAGLASDPVFRTVRAVRADRALEAAKGARASQRLASAAWAMEHADGSVIASGALLESGSVAQTRVTIQAQD